MIDSKQKPFVSSHYALVGLICLAYLALALYTAPHYGITWDEAMNEWYIGERNLRFYFTLNKSWLDFNQPVNFSMGGLHPDLRHTSGAWQTQNFGNMISSLGCYIFFVKLGWMDAVNAHRLPNFLLMAGVLAAIFTFVKKEFGLAVALISVFAVVFQPRFWADSHINSKDFPYACMMAFTMLAARHAILKRNTLWVIFSSVLLGLSGATKPNAVIIPLIILFWYMFVRKSSSITGESCVKLNKDTRYWGFIISLLASPLVAIATFFLAWPYLIEAPIKTLQLYLNWYLTWGASGEPGFQWATFGIFYLVQPPAALIFGSVGICMAIHGIITNKNREVNAFLFLWFALPVARVLLPRMHNYDGVRHFIEYAIPLGVFIGIGATGTFKWLASKLDKLSPRKKSVRHILLGTLIALPFLTWLITMIRIHPYEIVYFNFTLGGAKGVEKFCGGCGAATDYWGSSYRQGIDWLNANAEYGSTVVTPVAGHIVWSVQKMWMRRDLRLIITKHRSDELQEDLLGKVRTGPVYAMYITRKSAYGEFVRQVDSKGKLVYSIEVDGAPILKIMRMVSNSASVPLKNEKIFGIKQ